MTTPRQRRRSFALTVVLVAANLFLLNWIALGHFGRFDLTREGIYTLHPATVKLLQDLDDLVTMRVYLSDKRFREQPRYSHIPRQIQDLLDEFGSRAQGKLQIDYRDPSDDPAIAAEARAARVNEMDLTGFGEQTTVTFKAYLGIVLSYGGKPDEVIPVAWPPESLEYNLAMSLSRLTQRETITIGFNSVKTAPEGLPPHLAQQMGQDQNDIDGNWLPVKEALQKQFDVEKVPMDREIPAHVDLLVVHNVAGMDEKAQFYLDQYLMGGGKLIVLAEGTEENPQVRNLTARTSMPDALFAHYGFTIKKDLVLDRQCLVQLFQPPAFYVPHVQPRYFDPEAGLMNGVDAFYLPLPSSLELNPPAGIEGIVLAQSTPAAWAQEGFFDLRPDLQPPADVDEYRQFDLVGMLEGEFTSYFANRPIPDGVTTSSRGPTRGDLEAAGYIVGDEDGEADAGGDADADDGEQEEDAEEDDGQGDEEDGPPANDGSGGEDGSAESGEQDVPGGGIVQQELQDPDPQDPDPQDPDPQDPDPTDPLPQDPPAVPQPPPATPAPEEVPAEAPDHAGPPPGTTGALFIKEKSPRTTIVVVGNSRFMQGQSARQLPGNLAFFWTLLDRMTTGSDLTDIRNRSLAPPSIRADLSPATRAAIKYLGMLGMPVIVLVLGIATFALRRTRTARGATTP